MTDQTQPADGKPVKVPSAAQGFGIAGLIPLAAGAIAVWTLPTDAETRFVAATMLFYGATVLSFLGGVRWGLVLADDNPRMMKKHMLVGIAPPLIAWAMLLIVEPLGLEWGVLGLAVAFTLMLLSDLGAVKDGSAPPWYGALRWPLTLAADALLLIIYIRLVVL